MAEETHYWDLKQSRTACGSQDPSDVCITSTAGVTCNNCLYDLVKMDKIKREHLMADTRREPTEEEAYAHKDAAVAEHAEGCMRVIKEAETYRSDLLDQRNAILRQVAVWKSQIQVSSDTIARLNSLLGDQPSREGADAKVIR